MSTHLRATRTLPTLLVLPRMERMSMATIQYLNCVLQPGTSHQPSLASVTGSPASFSQASCRTERAGGWENEVSLSFAIQSWLMLVLRLLVGVGSVSRTGSDYSHYPPQYLSVSLASTT